MKSHKKEMSVKTTFCLVVIVLLLGIGGTMWYYALYKVAFVKVFDIEVKVVEGGRLIGFNADPTLHFGKIPAMGGMAQKELNLWNDWDIPLRIEIRVKGNASQFIMMEANGFIMQPGEIRTLKAYAVVPRGFNKTGIYTGEAKVLFLRP